MPIVPYGALVLKKAVCNGYAEGMKLLCDLSGVTCKMISGTADGEKHAWNLIKLDKEWYHADLTWMTRNRMRLPVLCTLILMWMIHR